MANKSFVKFNYSKRISEDEDEKKDPNGYLNLMLAYSPMAKFNWKCKCHCTQHSTALYCKGINKHRWRGECEPRTFSITNKTRHFYLNQYFSKSFSVIILILPALFHSICLMSLLLFQFVVFFRFFSILLSYPWCCWCSLLPLIIVQRLPTAFKSKWQHIKIMYCAFITNTCISN